MATIRDVALRAGVSASTVSYVLTGNKRLSPATVDRVRTSIQELGYRPDPAARAMSLGRTNVIALLVHVDEHDSDTDADIFMRFLRSALFTARRGDFDLMVMSKDVDQRPIPPLVDALLVMDVRLHDERLPAIAHMGLPTVLIGLPSERHGLAAVDLDFRAAGALAIQHLLGRGRRSIAVLAGPPGRQLSFEARFHTGVTQAAGQAADAGVFYEDSGASTADVSAWLRQGRAALGKVDAVVVLNVAALDALLRCLTQEQMVVPDDVALIVLAPDERMSLLYPDVTVIDLPGQVMMETAVNQVMDQLAAKPSDGVTLLAPQLLQRTST